MCDGSAFWPQLCGTMTTQPQAGSDGSQSPGLSWPHSWSLRRAPQFQGKEGPAIRSLSCHSPGHMHGPAQGAGLTPRRGQLDGKGRPVGAPLLPRASWGVALHGSCFPQCTVQGNSRLPLVLSHGCSSSSIPRYEAPSTVPWKKPRDLLDARGTRRPGTGLNNSSGNAGLRHGRSGNALPLRSLQSLTRPKVASLALIHTVPSSNTIPSPSQWTYTKVTEKRRYRGPGQTLGNSATIWQTGDHEGFQCMCLASDAKHGGRHQTHRAGKLNSTHSLLLCQGASQQLAITNTIFCLANKRYYGGTRNLNSGISLITNVACGGRWGCVQMTMTANTADSWGQHNWEIPEQTSRNSKMETRPGFSDSDPNGILKDVPN